MLSIALNADLIKMSSKIVRDNDDINDCNNLLQSKVKFRGTTKEYVKKYGLNVSIATTLYNRYFLLRNRIPFEACAIAEDALFNARCYTVDGTVVYTDAIVYAYYMRADSASHTTNKSSTERMINDYIYITKAFNQLKAIHSDIKEAFDKHILTLKNNAFVKISRTDDANLTEIKHLIAIAYKGGIFPLPNNSFKDIVKNTLLRNPWLLKFLSKHFKR